MRFDFDQEALFLQIGNHLFARGKAVQACVFFRQGKALLRFAFEVEHFGVCQHFGFQVEHINQARVVAFADFIVVEVVRRRDFHAAGAKIFFNVFVSNHGDGAAGQWQD